MNFPDCSKTDSSLLIQDSFTTNPGHLHTLPASDGVEKVAGHEQMEVKNRATDHQAG